MFFDKVLRKRASYLRVDKWPLVTFSSGRRSPQCFSFSFSFFLSFTRPPRALLSLWKLALAAAAAAVVFYKPSHYLSLTSFPTRPLAAYTKHARTQTLTSDGVPFFSAPFFNPGREIYGGENVADRLLPSLVWTHQSDQVVTVAFGDVRRRHLFYVLFSLSLNLSCSLSEQLLHWKNITERHQLKKKINWRFFVSYFIRPHWVWNLVLLRRTQRWLTGRNRGRKTALNVILILCIQIQQIRILINYHTVHECVDKHHRASAESILFPAFFMLPSFMHCEECAIFQELVQRWRVGVQITSDCLASCTNIPT